eukprot:2871439-Rhodomonas_salina.1
MEIPEYLKPALVTERWVPTADEHDAQFWSIPTEEGKQGRNLRYAIRTIGVTDEDLRTALRRADMWIGVHIKKEDTGITVRLADRTGGLYPEEEGLIRFIREDSASWDAKSCTEN